MGRKQIGIMGAMIFGSVIVAIIFVLGTIYNGRSASHDTEKVVRIVSHLYLDELSSRSEQVVADKISAYINDMNVALGILEESDLSSGENLRFYQAKMKSLYGLEKFAFVDTDGLIYTSKGTQSDINLYNFDYKSLSEPQISLKNSDGNTSTVIIAVPIDKLRFGDRILSVCFMEISMSRLLEGFSIQNGNEDTVTTFCNIYTKDGYALTNIILAGLAAEDNLFTALNNAVMEEGYSKESIRDDFINQNEGVVSFSYNDIRNTMYYAPIRNTDWMLTYLIRESVISEQISLISDGIIFRTLEMSIFASVILLLFFSAFFVQMRKTARLTLQKEVTDAENRVAQEELEEQLALQQQIARYERKRSEQDSMITAMASDYRSVYYVDLNADIGICYRKGTAVDAPYKEGDTISFTETFVNYANKFVVGDAYKEKFLEFIKPETIRAGLASSKMISLRYLVRHNGKETYEMLRMAGVRSKEERGDDEIKVVGVGFTDIDEEMRDSLAKNEALANALKVAEEASKAKTVFLSNMSHEIRTPMNAIIGLDSLALHEDNLPPKTRDYLEKIGSSAEHLLSLINDILDMSRIESGRMVIRNEEFAFSKFMEQVNTIFSGQCKEKGIIYTCRINGHLEDYYIGDDMKLRQVMINILGNAVKFTPEGGKINFIVENIASFDKKSTIQFKISDTGVGMSKEFLPKLFDTFSQENSKSSSKYGSTGLGMAITKNIVEMMNGKIEVESEKGRGTTFTVTVTLQDSDRKALDSNNEIEINTNELTVLVIDDDEVALDHAKLVLSKAGINAETAFSGAEALEMVKLRYARREPYKLIIVDWQMPEMDGLETTRKIREATGNESTVIILTSYNWDDILDEAIAAGVDSFIAKPIFTGNLIDEFKNVLKKKQSESLYGEKEKTDLNGKRILLAEDMEVNAQIMIEILSLRGMKTEHALNGKIALEMFKNSEENYYDAILMDMRMPEMNGLEASVAIRKLDRSDAKKIPIIALTANAFDEDVQRSLQSGLNAHLSKPVQPDLLFETLEGMI